jgi:amino acid transporter
MADPRQDGIASVRDTSLDSDIAPDGEIAPNGDIAPDLKAAEDRVEAHSAALEKQLGLTDLALTQVLFVVGLTWVGTAGKLGPSHAVFWMLAIVLFYIPSAIVVIYLNRLMPLEGGLYQWARLGFNDFVGFMVAWNLWLYVIVLTSDIGLLVATNLAYALGPNAAWMAGSKWFITLLSMVITAMLVTLAILGLGVSKWVHNAGGVVIIIVFLILVLLPLVSGPGTTVAEYRPFPIVMPAISLLSLNILGKMGFGALGGFEYVAILAGECHSPAKTIGRSVIVSAPIIALMFILGTSAVLAFVRPEDIDLIGPIPQVLSIGFGRLGLAGRIAPVVILALMGLRLAQCSVNFTANTRLPMVAGWDRLLPDWFTRLHKKHKTPINSTLFVGVMTLATGLAGIAGAGQQEAYQMLQSGSVIFYALTYLVMFAVPIVGLRGFHSRAALWIRIASASGFLMTLLNVVLSVFPIIEVQSRLSFAIKISGVIICANIIGGALFVVAERKRREEAALVAASSE